MKVPDGLSSDGTVTAYKIVANDAKPVYVHSRHAYDLLEDW